MLKGVWHMSAAVTLDISFTLRNERTDRSHRVANETFLVLGKNFFGAGTAGNGPVQVAVGVPKERHMICQLHCLLQW